MNRALMSDMLQYLLGNSRKMTKEESEAHSKILTNRGTAVRKLYDLDEPIITGKVTYGGEMTHRPRTGPVIRTLSSVDDEYIREMIKLCWEKGEYVPQTILDAYSIDDDLTGRRAT